VLSGIVQRSPYLIGIVTLCESAGGTYGDTLTAVDAGCICQLDVKCGRNVCVIAAVIGADDADILILLADCHAAAAEDTLGIVADKMNGGIVNIGLCKAFAVVILIYAVFICQSLKLTVLGTDAGKAVHSVVGKHKLQSLLTSFSQLGCIGENFHTLVYGVYASCCPCTGALDFDNAHTACADLVDVFKIAQCRDANSSFLSGL
jgi:hypothetical protein